MTPGRFLAAPRRIFLVEKTVANIAHFLVGRLHAWTYGPMPAPLSAISICFPAASEIRRFLGSKPPENGRLGKKRFTPATRRTNQKGPHPPAPSAGRWLVAATPYAIKYTPHAWSIEMLIRCAASTYADATTKSARRQQTRHPPSRELLRRLL